MTKRYFDILESLDSKLSSVIDQLEDERELQADDEDYEAVNDFIELLENIRGEINP